MKSGLQLSYSAARVDATRVADYFSLAKPRLVIGFAAETNDTHKHARQKLVRKGLDAVVVNDVSDPGIGFNSSHNAATLIYADGEVTFARQSKTQLAHGLIAQIVDIFASQLADTNPESVSE